MCEFTPTYDPLSMQSPDISERKMNVALQLHAEGCFADAEAVYRDLLLTEQESPELHKNLGNTLLNLGRFYEAEQAYRRAIQLKPDFAAAYNNLGNVLRLGGRLDEAVQAFHTALDYMPENSALLTNFGNVLLDLGKPDEAEKIFRKAVVLDPQNVEAYNNRGNSLLACGRLDVAEKCYRQAIELKSDYAESYCNLGNVLSRKGCLVEAEEAYVKALSINSDSAETYSNLGNLYLQRGLLEKAEQAYQKALSLKPDFPDGQFNLSQVKLLQGNFEEGFTLYEQRFRIGSGARTSSIRSLLGQLQSYPLWKGESLNKRSLLVVTEQGAGSNIMMMRYLPLLKQRGLERLTVYSELYFTRLLHEIPEVDDVIAKSEPLPLDEFDYYSTTMSLPYLFRTQLETIPAVVPYIKVPEEIKRQWHDRLHHIRSLKVGLAWAGNKFHTRDTFRSIALSEFSILNNNDDVTLVTLQKGEESIQLKNLGWNFLDLMDQCDDYLDTAGLLNELDLVITVDTSVAHLAGALGKHVWLLNRYESEWRWMLERTDSPWYPSMRIFRQQEMCSWDSVIDSVAKELQNLASENRGRIT